MIKEILHKHAVVGLNNGSMIEGFVQDGDEAYFRIVEWDNNLVIVRIDEISFARLTAHCEQPVNRLRWQPAAGQVPQPAATQPRQSYPPQSVIADPVEDGLAPSPPLSPAAVQLDEEGFAIGLPRGVVTQDCPSQVPIAGPDDGMYGLPFTPRTRR